MHSVRPFSRDPVVDHIDSRHIVFLRWSGIVLWVSKFKKDGMGIFSLLCGSDCGKKLSFGTGCSSSKLSFGAIRDNTIVEEKSIASWAMVKVIGVSSIDETNRLAWCVWDRKVRET